jgi:hypothetical protein
MGVHGLNVQLRIFLFVSDIAAFYPVDTLLKDFHFVFSNTRTLGCIICITHLTTSSQVHMLLNPTSHNFLI